MLRENSREALDFLTQATGYSLSILIWTMSILLSSIVFVLALSVAPTIVAGMVGYSMNFLGVTNATALGIASSIWVVVFGIQLTLASTDAKKGKR